MEHCDQTEIGNGENQRKAFSIMIRKDAKKFYFQTLKFKNIDIPVLILKTRNCIKIEERARALLCEWDDMILNNVRRTNSTKNMTQSLKRLTDCLSDIQCFIHEQCHNDQIMRDKLLNAIRDTTACRLAYQKP